MPPGLSHLADDGANEFVGPAGALWVLDTVFRREPRQKPQGSWPREPRHSAQTCTHFRGTATAPPKTAPHTTPIPSRADQSVKCASPGMPPRHRQRREPSHIGCTGACSRVSWQTIPSVAHGKAAVLLGADRRQRPRAGCGEPEPQQATAIRPGWPMAESVMPAMIAVSHEARRKPWRTHPVSSTTPAASRAE